MLRQVIASVVFGLSVVAAVAFGGDPWLSIPGGEGPGKGKHVVLVSGDEEYRSEEALTQLAKILAKHHGFECMVLYAIDPETGVIDPNQRHNIPGLEALRKADVMVIATRFRTLPDEQMREIDAYLRAGKPVVGLRTATHAFDFPTGGTFEMYHWKHGGEGFAEGFGRQVLGETWISHHGQHGKEGTRGLVVPEAKGHPILRGIGDGDIYGPSDVYGVEGQKNDPMMPIAWTKTYAIEGGPAGRVFTTTMGASQDMLSAGLRRLLVNACYWATGLDDAIPATSAVDIVGTFEPSPFKNNGFRVGVKPADLK